jgi:hypothetical protein
MALYQRWSEIQKGQSVPGVFKSLDDKKICIEEANI